MNSNEKIPKPQGRYVPWATWDEWITTYKSLYSSEDRDVTHALHTVDVWRIRGRVPLAVDATATLRRIWQLDEGRTLDAQTLRLQYSLAIVRFVNGVADAAQKGRVAASVASLANQACIPRLLVDIRHESTHNELPTLCVLRMAATQALEWLQRWYWEAQRQGIIQGRERVSEVVQAYVKSLLMASMKEDEQNASSGRGRLDDDDDGDDEWDQGGTRSTGRTKRKKARTVGRDGHDENDEDDEDDEDDEHENNTADATKYCPRKEKKIRQALLNELRGMLAVGEETLLAHELLCSDIGSTSWCMEKTSQRVLDHLGDVWPDLAATLLMQWMDTSLSRCLDTLHGDALETGNHANDGGERGICWCRAAMAVLTDASIDSIVDQCIRRNCLKFYAVHQNAFIEVKSNATMEEALARLRRELQDLGERTPMLREFLLLFLPTTTPVDAHMLQGMKDRIKEWTSVQEKAQKNTSGWSQVNADSWRPCAVGMMPSNHLANGSLPDLACYALQTSSKDDWRADAVVVNMAPPEDHDRHRAIPGANAPNAAFNTDDTGDANDTDSASKTIRTDEGSHPSCTEADDEDEGDDGDEGDGTDKADEAGGQRVGFCLLPPRDFQADPL